MISNTYGYAEVQTAHPQRIQKMVCYAPFVITAGLFIGCLVMELLHVEISAAGRAQFYSVFGSVCHYCCILLNTIYGGKYGLGWLKSLIFSVLSFELVFGFVSVTWTDVDIQLFGTGTVASYRSAMLLPLLCLVLSRFCQVDTLNLCDFLTPYFFFKHGIVTVACWVEGCCAGKSWSWGLLNPLTGTVVFPTQPCIIILSVAVAYWGLEYAEKQNYQANGMVFANSLIIYGCVRYVLELFSDDPRMFGVMSWLGICALMSIALGFFVRRISEKHYQTP